MWGMWRKDSSKYNLSTSSITTEVACSGVVKLATPATETIDTGLHLYHTRIKYIHRSFQGNLNLIIELEHMSTRIKIEAGLHM